MTVEPIHREQFWTHCGRRRRTRRSRRSNSNTHHAAPLSADLTRYFMGSPLRKETTGRSPGWSNRYSDPAPAWELLSRPRFGSRTRHRNRPLSLRTALTEHHHHPPDERPGIRGASDETSTSPRLGISPATSRNTDTVPAGIVPHQVSSSSSSGQNTELFNPWIRSRPSPSTPGTVRRRERPGMAPERCGVGRSPSMSRAVRSASRPEPDDDPGTFNGAGACGATGGLRFPAPASRTG